MKKLYRKPEVVSDDMFEQTANQTGPNITLNCEIPSLVDASCQESGTGVPADGICDGPPPTFDGGC